MDKKESVWIPGDQLLADHPALVRAEEQVGRKKTRVVLIESQDLIAEKQSHPLKLILILSAMRHYAAELEREGWAVDYRPAPSFAAGLSDHIQVHQPDKLITMAASTYRGRQYQKHTLPGQSSLPVEVLPNTQFLVGRHDPRPDPDPEERVVMEYFYRSLRRHFGVLLDEEENPAGGEWNYDPQNRKPLPDHLTPPPPRTFSPDKITRKVIAELKSSGRIDHDPGFDLAVSHQDALRALEDFIQHRLPEFGPYEDAMAERSPVLYHSRLSPYLNLGLLNPDQVIRAAEEAYREGQAPVQSAEGFIRQVLGWREYTYWQYWRGMPDLIQGNHFQAQRALPDFFWTGETDLNCLHHTLQEALTRGYNHHIQRLMILSNFCTLGGFQPRQVLDWFMATYIDAYPWVMVPNVIGMGLYADGGMIGTKPYVASANYIQRMSDYCPSCVYDQNIRTGENACPYNTLYWNFLLQHQDQLRANPRMGLMISNLRHLNEGEKKQIRNQAASLLANLEAGNAAQKKAAE